jgi:ABC-type transport system involved in multi-copper enzyme maturation permease subunit
MRSKILYSLLFFGALLVGVSVFFGTVTIGERARVVKDFGLFSLSILTALYAVIAGSTLLHKELARKTVYNILSRPISRWQFLAGKFFGLFFTVAAMLGLMSITFTLFTCLLDGSFDTLLLVATLYILLELAIVCAVTIFFSAIVVTPILSGLFSFGLFLVGRSSGILEALVEQGASSGFSGQGLKAIYFLLPNLEMLNVSNAVVYGVSPGPSHTFWALAYTVCYCAGIMTIGSLVFEKREFR